MAHSTVALTSPTRDQTMTPEARAHIHQELGDWFKNNLFATTKQLDLDDAKLLVRFVREKAPETLPTKRASTE